MHIESLSVLCEAWFHFKFTYFIYLLYYYYYYYYYYFTATVVILICTSRVDYVGTFYSILIDLIQYGQRLDYLSSAYTCSLTFFS